MKYVALSTLALAIGVILDLIFADPNWMPHPVIWMGNSISKLEKSLRKNCETPEQTLKAGRRLAFILPVCTFLISGSLCVLAYWIHPILGLVLESIWCGQCLAMNGLRQAGKKVYDELTKQDLPAARIAVSWIVGRDTSELTEVGVAKATIETIAENSSDGVIAPLFYMMLGGAPLGLTYKSVNTMDSMVGYKNERFLYFGRAAAKLDDFCNYLPARISALFWIVGAPLCGFNGKDAWRIWRRDRRQHASPNSAQTESCCAGALGIQLAGPAYYFGEYYDKPTLGDAKRPVESEDIPRSSKLMYCAGLLAAVCFVAIKAGIVLLLMK